MAEAPERETTSATPDELAALRGELATERARREAVDAENARLQAQIESYAEDLSSLYQERHGRGRGGLSAELSKTRAELADEAAQREVLGALYQNSTRELRSLGDQLVTYGEDLAKAYKAGKKAAADRPVSWRERAGAATLMLGMLGTVAAGLILSPPELGSSPVSPTATSAASPGAEIRVVSSAEGRPDVASAAAAAAAVATASASGAGDGAGTATAVAREVGASAATATSLAARSASSAATAAAAATSLAASAGTATAVAAAAPPGAATPGAPLVAGPAATATAATGAARTAIAFAAEANATATVAVGGAATALAAVGQRAGTATAIALPGASSAATTIAATTAAGGGAPTPTASPVERPSPSATPGPDLRPTVTALAGTVEQVSAESTVQAATATVFAREASAVAVTATAFALTATAPTTTPTATAAARAGPPRPLGDLERCSWEVPIPSIAPGRGYYVQFAQSNRATVTVLWSHADGAMALSALAEGTTDDWRAVTPSARGDVVANGLEPATYRVHLRNEGATASSETMIALFYDELALCVEPTGYPEEAGLQVAPAVLGQSVATDAAPPKRPFLDCRPYVRAPFGFVQVHPRLFIDRARRIEGTMPVTIKLTGPGTNLTLELVAGPGRRAERIPLTNFGRYQLEAIAEGVEKHENCGEGFWFERTNPALPTLPAPPE